MSIIQGIIFIKRKVSEQVRTFGRDSIYYFVKSNDAMNKKTIESPSVHNAFLPCLYSQLLTVLWRVVSLARSSQAQ